MPTIDAKIAPEAGWRRSVRNWNAFWFTPRDPLLLGVMRICTGAVFCYSLIVHTFCLNDFFGPHAWIDLEAVRETVLFDPLQTGTLSGQEWRICEPTTQEEHVYAEKYFASFHEPPPCPFPKTEQEAKYCEEFRMTYGFDLRYFGLPPPKNAQEWLYVKLYAEKHKQAMPPPYPKNDAEVKEIDDYIERYDVDPRRCYSRGLFTFSIWYHLQDPFWMGVTHALFIGVALLFTLGVATRLTSFLTWFAAVSYIQRNIVVGYGVDTMMSVLMLYLAIGPSGAALSLDRWLARWWSGRRGQTLAPPQASVCANVALRLLQIHVCIIYAAAGFSKLQGNAWWSGTALWYVLGNFEFAPMNWELYHRLLRTLGSNQLVWESVLTVGAYFTLFFEMMYVALIWLPSTRWLMLASAILLHGVIGVFMGLGTFALIMLVMNMAFLHDHEIAWMLRQFGIEPPRAEPA